MDKMLKIFRGDFNHLIAKKPSYKEGEYKEQTKLDDLIKSA